MLLDKPLYSRPKVDVNSFWKLCVKANVRAGVQAVLTKTWQCQCRSLPSLMERWPFVKC